ncbi:MAG: tetratricopeptide repeat protein [Acidobacteriota bacterium]|nr:tetratricopeptide repeat protein [Acidobacteriota bacterium]
MILPLLFLLLFPGNLPAQASEKPATAAQARQLYEAGRYEELVKLVPPSPGNPPELDLYLGMALAKLQRWPQARAALEAGHAKAPRDERFLVELAGVDYKTRNYDSAKSELRQALALDPGDTYARNFLATIYLLTENLDAALDNWNKIGKPHITDISMEPKPRLKNEILQRAFAFSPLSTLRLSQLRTTEARIDNLNLFPMYHFDLVPDNSSYTVDFVSTERNGFGSNKFEALASIFRDIPIAVDPEYYNLGGKGINLLSYFRWDENKRRVWASVSTPVEDNPSLRAGLYTDARNENWDLSRTFRGSTAPLTDLNMERIEFGPQFRSVVNGRWSWQAHLVYAYRRFRNVRDVLPAYTFFFTNTGSLEYRMRTDYRLIDIPDRRLTLTSWVRGSFGKNFAAGLGAFGGIEGSLELDWFPKPSGDDYQTTLRFRIGRNFGNATLDELYQLGVERDNDLWVRGISGTREGFKGNAPLGREFVLWNWETDKTVYKNPFLSIQIGPFVDIGKDTDPSGVFGSRFWLWDPGLQCKFRIFGDIVVLVSYGRDLHSGSGAFYETTSR